MKQGELNKYGCINLANGIIVLASKDYIKAIKQLQKNPRSKVGISVVKECEDFFRGPWFANLTSINGEWLINRLREEALKK